MNKQGNAYTFLYASIMVIIVAALLAFLAQALKPMQVENEMVAKKISILGAINVGSTAENADEIYSKIIGESSYIVNFSGEKIDGEAFNVDMATEVRKNMQDRNYPVFEANLEDGSKKYIIELRGNGLWGPIWGYLALNDDASTIYGATFAHQGETPGLGAEIDRPDFQSKFKGKKVFEDGSLMGVKVIKNASKDSNHEVDAISGGTITSNGVSDMVNNFFKGYENFLKNIERESHE